MRTPVTMFPGRHVVMGAVVCKNASQRHGIISSVRRRHFAERAKAGFPLFCPYTFTA